MGNCRGYLMRRSTIYGGSATPPMAGIFSTDLWTGNGSSRTITTGVDLSGSNEGLVWIKERGSSNSHYLFDTIRGSTKYISSNSTSPQTTTAQTLTSFGSSGFDLGTDTGVNNSSDTYVGWTIKTSPGFFDIVQYVGSGSTPVAQNISHNLGTVPGCIIVKGYNDALKTISWYTYHRSLNGGTTPENYGMFLNAPDVEAIRSDWDSTPPTSSHFRVGATAVNIDDTYISYIFGHEPTPNGRVFCGGFATDGSGNATVNIGWKPAFVIMKPRDVGTEGWIMLDTQRGWGPSGNLIYADTNDAESPAAITSASTSSGFTVAGAGSSYNYIFVAIRAEGF